jgi:nucleotide-binding universal stress UspA family protein
MKNAAIRRILVPTDLSAFSLAALRFAELFHDRLGARGTILLANEPIYPVASFEESLGLTWNSDMVRAKLRQELAQHLADVVKVPAAYDIRVVDDIASGAIASTAKEIDADLIVMGTHGRTGWRRALLGSVSERVLRETAVPVMTVNASAVASQRVAVETVICPVNFSSVAHDAVQYASALAARFDAQLIVLNVEEEPSPAVNVKRDFSGWVDAALRDRCDYLQLVVKGDAAEAVLEAAAQYRADLIVIGAQHRRFSNATVIGTTTERITRFAWQPVLTVIRQPMERAAVAA